MRIVLDACSFMHFLAAGEQNVLVKWAEKLDAKLTVTKTVAEEIATTSRGPKFSGTGAHGTWMRLETRVMVVEEDLESDPALWSAMASLHQVDLQSRSQSGARQPLTQRLASTKDLGEFVTVAYAIALARQGHEVIVVCDDRGGRRLVKLAKYVINREYIAPTAIRLTCTRDVVERANPEWRRDSRTSAETIVAMESIESLPDWSDGR